MFEKGVASMLDPVKEFVRNEPLRPLVGGSSAWVGSTLRARPETWTHTQSMDEIEAAVTAVMMDSVDGVDITLRNFPLLRFGRTLDALCREIADGRGFVLIRGWPTVGRPTLESAIAYCGIRSYFGTMWVAKCQRPSVRARPLLRQPDSSGRPHRACLSHGRTLAVPHRPLGQNYMRRWCRPDAGLPVASL